MAEAEEYFKKLVMSKDQKNICDRVAKMLNMYLSTNMNALRYFIGKTLFTWQEKTGKPIVYLETASPEERLKIVRAWFDKLNSTYLTNILEEDVNPDTLTNALEFAFIFYQEKYAYR